MKQGITINDILALADIQMKVYDLSVGAFMDEIEGHYSLDLTKDDLDLIEKALIEKVIVNSLDRIEIIDLIINYSYEFKMSKDNEYYSVYDDKLGKVTARNLYEVLRDLINS